MLFQNFFLQILWLVYRRLLLLTIRRISLTRFCSVLFLQKRHPLVTALHSWAVCVIQIVHWLVLRAIFLRTFLLTKVFHATHHFLRFKQPRIIIYQRHSLFLRNQFPFIWNLCLQQIHPFDSFSRIFSQQFLQEFFQFLWDRLCGRKFQLCLF